MIQFKNEKKSSFLMDITPLIDVIFQVILFLILSVGKINFFLDIKLPKLEESYTSENKNVPIISLQKVPTGHYNILWNQKNIGLLEIESYLQKEKPEKLILRADKDIPYGFFMQVLGKIQKQQNVELFLEYELDTK